MDIRDLQNINETSGLTTHGTPRHETTKKKDGEIYHPLEQEAPGPRTLGRCTLHQCATAMLRGSRVVGAAMIGAGAASGICTRMMNESTVNPNQPIVLGIGFLLYLGSLAPAITLPLSTAKAFSLQAGMDAIVPALTAFSLYFIQAHDGI